MRTEGYGDIKERDRMDNEELAIIKRLISNIRYHERLIRGARFPGNKEAHCDAVLLECLDAEKKLGLMEPVDTPG